MHTALNWLIIVSGLVALWLALVLTLRAKKQHGFLAPFGFVIAVLLHRVSLLLSLPMLKEVASEESQEKMHQMAVKLSENDLMFMLSLRGQQDGIWQLGAILFILCGFLDLKSSSDGQTKKLRYGLIIVGTVLMIFSVFYPYIAYSKMGF
ncbi:hypothetical protein [Prosthecobacter sp.]|uniref:hypothetical protein n=1 Tax=Prosthecobacter sp. TaxID=1965333 RepID=UPI0024877F47|nr:hypothetical protein [Prosthecobacter sp.]MDI1314180.1 hypothetical protein [Prosthecobacter sp.]